MDAADGRHVLELDDVRFSYQSGTNVLDGVSLSVPAGSIVGVVGPSGCGKSTLLSLISGLLEPSSGTLTRDVSGSDRHPLAMVFQKDTLLPWLSVADNVKLFARFKQHGGKRDWRGRRGRSDAGELDERVRSLLELAKLDEWADSYPYQLSGGMRRRLAFLAAVAPNPQILLLDEPFSSVDEPTRVGIHQDVFRITQMMKTTTFLVTHDLAEAITLCDRVLILSKRPARIVHEHTIPFGQERNMLELRERDEYLEIYGRLWHDLSAEIAKAPARVEVAA
jgi:ABC-type nitrate/sulfonate/bicarbonate transport system ATPase subunit